MEELAKVEAQISIDPERFVDYKRISARIGELDVEIVKIESEIKLEEAVEAVEAAKAEALESEDETEAYEVPEGEEHLYHAMLESGVKFNPNTGERISKPYVQKFTYKEFKQFEKNAAILGYTYKVLHQPE